MVVRPPNATVCRHPETNQSNQQNPEPNIASDDPWHHAFHYDSVMMDARTPFGRNPSGSAWCSAIAHRRIPKGRRITATTPRSLRKPTWTAGDIGNNDFNALKGYHGSLLPGFRNLPQAIKGYKTAQKQNLLGTEGGRHTHTLTSTHKHTCTHLFYMRFVQALHLLADLALG